MPLSLDQKTSPRTAVDPETELFKQFNPDHGNLESQALKNVFTYLSVLFRYPSETVYQEIARHLETFEGFFLKYAGQVPELPGIEDLQAEYINLFVNNQGFVPAHPYASAYLEQDGQLMGDSWNRLQNMMIQFGVTLDPSLKELEDHISILLEFCARLIDPLLNHIPAKASQDTVFLTALTGVIELYIKPMTDGFTDGIRQGASFDFYRVAGNALHGLFADSDVFLARIMDVEQA